MSWGRLFFHSLALYVCIYRRARPSGSPDHLVRGSRYSGPIDDHPFRPTCPDGLMGQISNQPWRRPTQAGLAVCCQGKVVPSRSSGRMFGLERGSITYNGLVLGHLTKPLLGHGRQHYRVIPPPPLPPFSLFVLPPGLECHFNFDFRLDFGHDATTVN